ncbi:MAG: GTP 3',8-cyclase MoaA [Deltaproteobacteria bacterium]|nr:GTP 3',8-cyclase MoaA [Deltaproteobacteria bacterium]
MIEAPLFDAQGRRMTYLRLSLTDRCNFRCVYCSPATWGGKSHLLSAVQLERLVTIFAGVGIRRVRLTGGEPLFRKDILDVVTKLAAVPGIGEVCATTNGHQLAELAAPLKQAGLRSLNVSLDTLDAERFRTLSGGRGEVARVIEGVDAALAAGLEVKLNAVVLRGVNEDDCASLVQFAWQRGIVVRFIECMPFREGKPVPTAELVEKLRAEDIALEPDEEAAGLPHGPARYFRGARGRVGFISPMTQNFCGGCNRVRVAANGDLRACLGGREQAPLSTLLNSGADDTAILSAIRAALGQKPEGHRFNDVDAKRALLPMMGIGG